MRVTRRFACLAAALAVCLASSSAFAQNLPWVDPPKNLEVVDQAINAIWNPVDGSLQIIAANTGGMTTTVITSASMSLDPAVAVADGNIADPPVFPDINTTEKFFKLTPQPNEKSEWNFSAGFTPTATEDPAYCFRCDTIWSGSLFPSGSWQDAPGGGPYLHVVPEPSSIVLVLCGMLGLLKLRRK